MTSPVAATSARCRLGRLVSLGAALLCTVGVLAACGGSSAAVGPTTIKFSYLWTGPEAKALQKIIADFNASQHTIHVVGVSNPDTQAQLAAMTSSKGAFDISDTFDFETGAWASKGIITPLTPYIQQDHYSLADFVPTALEKSEYQGTVYTMPIAVHDLMLVYNKQLFKNAGITAPPVTTSQLAADTAKLTKTGPNGLTQLGLGSSSGGDVDYTTLAMAFGGHWYQGSTPTPDVPANIDAASFYVNNVIKKYGVSAVQKFTSGFGQYESPQNPLYQGKLAMTIDGEWQAQFIKEFAPNLQWGVAPLPYPDGHPELAGTSQLTSSTLFIPANSQHKQQAWDFMKYLLSPQPMASFTLALANLPSRKSLLTSPAYQQIPQFSAWLNELKSNNLQILPSVPSYAQYTADLGNAFDAISLLKQTPQTALAALAKKNYG